MIDRFPAPLLQGKRQARCERFSPAALRLLMDYDWPGNVRELENVVERAVVLSTQEAMDVDLLPESVRTREIVKGVRLQLSRFLAADARRSRRHDTAAPSPLAISNPGRSRAPHNHRHAGAHQLEPNRSRRTLSNPIHTLNQKIKRLGIETRRRNPATRGTIPAPFPADSADIPARN